MVSQKVVSGCVLALLQWYTNTDAGELDLVCNQAFDPNCYGHSFNLNASDSVIYCRGFSSCRDTKEVIVSGGDDDVSTFSKQFIYCAGGLSCANASSLHAVNYENRDVNGKITCFGHGSCYQSSLQSQDSVTCQGSRACASALISSRSGSASSNSPDSLSLECSGEFSCANATITDASIVQGSGRLALLNGVISSSYTSHSSGFGPDGSHSSQSSGGSGLEVILSGHMSGYNATIFCNDAPSCTLMCQGNGCHGTRFWCDDSRSDCVVDCDDEESDVCPMLCDQDGCGSMDYDDFVDFVGFEGPLKPNEAMELIKGWDSVETCFGDGVDMTQCDDYFECFMRNDTFWVGEKGLCCRGSNACGVAAVSGVFDLSAESDSRMVCDGYSSCAQADVKSVDATGLQVHCNGAYGCLSMKFAGVTEGRDESVIKCGGNEACQMASITNAASVECNGDNACLYSVLERVQKVEVFGHYGMMFAVIRSGGLDVNVTLDAYQAGYGGSVYCQEGDLCRIQCGASEACSELTLYCDGLCEIECDESRGLSCPILGSQSDTLDDSDNGDDSDQSSGSGRQSDQSDFGTFFKENEGALAGLVVIVVLFVVGCVAICGRRRKMMQKSVYAANNWKRIDGDSDETIAMAV